MIGLLLPLLALAGSPVKLGPSYKVEATPPRETLADVRYVIVEKDGVRYRKFSGEAGDLLVIEGQKLTRASIESGQCFDESEVRDPRAGRDSVAPLVVAERKLTAGEVKAFAGLIQETTYSKCNNYQTAKVKLPVLGVGVSKTVTDSHGTSKEYRLYNTNLRPNLNFSGQF